MNSNFAIKLKMARIKKGYSQLQLANKIHVSRTLVAKWEQNKALPGLDLVESISEVLDVPLDFLIENDIREITKDPFLKWKIANIILITLIVIVFYAFVIYLFVKLVS